MNVLKRGVLNKCLEKVVCRECEAELEVFISDIKYSPAKDECFESFKVICPECETVIYLYDLSEAAKERIRDHWFRYERWEDGQEGG